MSHFLTPAIHAFSFFWFCACVSSTRPKCAKITKHIFQQANQHARGIGRAEDEVAIG
jgi:hypothetical protein